MRNGFHKKCAILFILVGSLLRCSQYFYNTSLWLDEAKFALKIRTFSYLQLFSPELHPTATAQLKAQSAPLGFFYCVKFLSQIFGDYEYVLRAIPLASSLLMLVLFYRLAKRIVSKSAALLALALASVNLALIYFSKDFHQYSSDALIVILILLMGDALITKPLSRKSVIGYGLAGAALIWFSYPSVFALSGVGAAALYCFIKKKDQAGIFKTMIIALFWGISFILSFMLYAKYFANLGFVQSYWEKYMLLPPYNISDIHLLRQGFRLIMVNSMGDHIYGAILFGFAVLGIGSMMVRNRAYVLLIGLPILSTLAASMLGKYPLFFRIILFLAPLLILFISEGVDFVCTLLPKKKNVIGLVACTVLLLYPYTFNFHKITNPMYRQEIKPVMEFINSQKRDGDILYLYTGAQAAFDYYAPQFNFDNVQTIRGKSHRNDRELYLAQLDALLGNERVWLLFSHIYNDEDVYMYDYLETIGKLLNRGSAPGAHVLLYDLSQQTN